VRVGLGHVAAEQGRERLHAERESRRLEDVDLPLPLPVQPGVAGLEQRRPAIGVHVGVQQALGGELVDEGEHPGRQRLVEDDAPAVVGEHLAAGLAVQRVEQPPGGGRIVYLVADRRRGPELLQLAQHGQHGLPAPDRRELARAVEQACLPAEPRVVVLHERVGIQRDGEQLAVEVSLRKGQRGEILRLHPVGGEQVQAERGQHAGRPEFADPAQVHDGHVRRAARADRQGELRIVRISPGQDRGLETDAWVCPAIASFHRHHVGPVAPGQQVPVDECAGVSPPLEPVSPAATSYVPAQPAVMAAAPSVAAPARKRRRLKEAGPATVTGPAGGRIVLMPKAPPGA